MKKPNTKNKNKKIILSQVGLLATSVVSTVSLATASTPKSIATTSTIKLSEEINKFSSFNSFDNVESSTAKLKLDHNVDVKNQFESILGYQKPTLNSGVFIDKVFVKKALDPTTRQVVFSVVIKDSRDQIISKDVTVTFASYDASLKFELNKFRNFSAFDHANSPIALKMANAGEDVKAMFTSILGYIGPISKLTKGTNLEKVFVKKGLIGRKVVYTIVVKRDSGETAKKDIVVTFSKYNRHLKSEANKFSSFNSFDSNNSPIAKKVPNFIEDVKSLFTIIPGYEGPSSPLTSGIVLNKVFVTKPLDGNKANFALIIKNIATGEMERKDIAVTFASYAKNLQFEVDKFRDFITYEKVDSANAKKPASPTKDVKEEFFRLGGHAGSPEPLADGVEIDKVFVVKPLDSTTREVTYRVIIKKVATNKVASKDVVVTFSSLDNNLQVEADKFTDFIAFDKANSKIATKAAIPNEDVKTLFTSILGYPGPSKPLASGIVLDKAFIKAPFDATTRKVTYRLVLKKTGAKEAIAKDVTVTFATDVEELQDEVDKFGDFKAFDNVKAKIAKKAASNLEDVKTMFEGILGYRGPKKPLATGVALDKVFVKKALTRKRVVTYTLVVKKTTTGETATKDIKVTFEDYNKWFEKDANKFSDFIAFNNVNEPIAKKAVSTTEDVKAMFTKILGYPGPSTPLTKGKVLDKVFVKKALTNNKVIYTVLVKRKDSRYADKKDITVTFNNYDASLRDEANKFSDFTSFDNVDEPIAKEAMSTKKDVKAMFEDILGYRGPSTSLAAGVVLDKVFVKKALTSNKVIYTLVIKKTATGATTKKDVAVTFAKSEKTLQDEAKKFKDFKSFYLDSSSHIINEPASNNKNVATLFKKLEYVNTIIENLSSGVLLDKVFVKTAFNGTELVATIVVKETTTGARAKKDITITFAKKDTSLQLETNKFSDFTSFDNVDEPIAKKAVSTTEDVKAMFEDILGYHGPATPLAAGVVLDKVFVTKALTGNEVVYKIILGKTATGQTVEKDIKVTFASYNSSLEAEANKFSDFVAFDNVNEAIAKKAVSTTEDIKTMFEDILGYPGPSAPLATGIILDKVFVKNALTSNKVVYTLLIKKVATNEVIKKDVTVTFAKYDASLDAEANKFSDFVAFDNLDIAIAKERKAANKDVKQLFVKILGYRGSSMPLATGVVLDKVFVKKDFEFVPRSTTYTLVIAKRSGAKTKKDVTVTFAKYDPNLQAEANKFDNFITLDNIKSPVAILKFNLGVDVKNQFTQMLGFAKPTLASGVTIDKVVVKEALDLASRQVTYTIVVTNQGGAKANKDVVVTFAGYDLDLETETNKFTDFNSLDSSKSPVAILKASLTNNVKLQFESIWGYNAPNLPDGVVVAEVFVKTAISPVNKVEYILVIKDNNGARAKKEITVSFTAASTSLQNEVNKFSDFETSENIKHSLALLKASFIVNVKDQIQKIAGYPGPSKPLASGIVLNQVFVRKALTKNSVIYTFVVEKTPSTAISEIAKKDITVTFGGYDKSLESEIAKFKDFESSDTLKSKVANLDASLSTNIKAEFEKIVGYVRPSLSSGVTLSKVYVKEKLNTSNGKVSFTIVIKNSANATMTKTISVGFVRPMEDEIVKFNDFYSSNNVQSSFATLKASDSIDVKDQFQNILGFEMPYLFGITKIHKVFVKKALDSTTRQVVFNVVISNDGGTTTKQKDVIVTFSKYDASLQTQIAKISDFDASNNVKFPAAILKRSLVNNVKDSFLEISGYELPLLPFDVVLTKVYVKKALDSRTRQVTYTLVLENLDGAVATKDITVSFFAYDKDLQKEVDKFKDFTASDNVEIAKTISKAKVGTLVKDIFENILGYKGPSKKLADGVFLDKVFLEEKLTSNKITFTLFVKKAKTNATAKKDLVVTFTNYDKTIQDEADKFKDFMALDNIDSEIAQKAKSVAEDVKKLFMAILNYPGPSKPLATGIELAQVFVKQPLANKKVVYTLVVKKVATSEVAKKDVTVTFSGYDGNLQYEAEKYKDFESSDNINWKFVKKIPSTTEDVKTMFTKILDYNGPSLNLAKGVVLDKVFVKKAFDATTREVVYSLIVKNKVGAIGKKDVVVTFSKYDAALGSELAKFNDFDADDNIRTYVSALQASPSFDVKIWFEKILGYTGPTSALPSTIKIHRVFIKTPINLKTREVVYTLVLVNSNGAKAKKDIVVTFKDYQPALENEAAKFQSFTTTDTAFVNTILNAKSNVDLKTEFESLGGYKQPKIGKGVEIYKAFKKELINDKKTAVFTLIIRKGDATIKKEISVTLTTLIQSEANKFTNFESSDNVNSQVAKLASSDNANVKEHFEKILGYDPPTLSAGTKIHQVFVKKALDKKTRKVVFEVLVIDNKGTIASKEVAITFSKYKAALQDEVNKFFGFIAIPNLTNAPTPLLNSNLVDNVKDSFARISPRPMPTLSDKITSQEVVVRDSINGSNEVIYTVIVSNKDGAKASKDVVVKYLTLLESEANKLVNFKSIDNIKSSFAKLSANGKDVKEQFQKILGYKAPAFATGIGLLEVKVKNELNSLGQVVFVVSIIDSKKDFAKKDVVVTFAKYDANLENELSKFSDFMGYYDTPTDFTKVASNLKKDFESIINYKPPSLSSFTQIHSVIVVENYNPLTKKVKLAIVLINSDKATAKKNITVTFSSIYNDINKFNDFSAIDNTNSRMAKKEVDFNANIKNYFEKILGYKEPILSFGVEISNVFVKTTIDPLSRKKVFTIVLSDGKFEISKDIIVTFNKYDPSLKAEADKFNDFNAINNIQYSAATLRTNYFIDVKNEFESILGYNALSLAKGVTLDKVFVKLGLNSAAPRQVTYVLVLKNSSGANYKKDITVRFKSHDNLLQNEINKFNNFVSSDTTKLNIANLKPSLRDNVKDQFETLSGFDMPHLADEVVIDKIIVKKPLDVKTRVVVFTIILFKGDAYATKDIEVTFAQYDQDLENEANKFRNFVSSGTITRALSTLKKSLKVDVKRKFGRIAGYVRPSLKRGVTLDKVFVKKALDKLTNEMVYTIVVKKGDAVAKKDVTVTFITPLQVEANKFNDFATLDNTNAKLAKLDANFDLDVKEEFQSLLGFSLPSTLGSTVKILKVYIKAKLDIATREVVFAVVVANAAGASAEKNVIVTFSKKDDLLEREVAKFGNFHSYDNINSYYARPLKASFVTSYKGMLESILGYKPPQLRPGIKIEDVFLKKVLNPKNRESIFTFVISKDGATAKKDVVITFAKTDPILKAEVGKFNDFTSSDTYNKFATLEPNNWNDVKDNFLSIFGYKSPKLSKGVKIEQVFMTSAPLHSGSSLYSFRVTFIIVLRNIAGAMEKEAVNVGFFGISNALLSEANKFTDFEAFDNVKSKAAVLKANLNNVKSDFEEILGYKAPKLEKGNIIQGVFVRKALNELTRQVTYTIVIKNLGNAIIHKDITVTFNKYDKSLKNEIMKFKDFSSYNDIDFEFAKQKADLNKDVKNKFEKLLGYEAPNLGAGVTLDKVFIKETINRNREVHYVIVISKDGAKDQKNIIVTFSPVVKSETTRLGDEFIIFDNNVSEAANLSASPTINVKDQFLAIVGYGPPTFGGGISIKQVFVKKPLDSENKVVFEVVIGNDGGITAKKDVTLIFKKSTLALEIEKIKFKDFKSYDTINSRAAKLRADSQINVEDQFNSILGYNKPSLSPGITVDRIIVKKALNKATRKVVYSVIIKNNRDENAKVDVAVTFLEHSEDLQAEVDKFKDFISTNDYKSTAAKLEPNPFNNVKTQFDNIAGFRKPNLDPGLSYEVYVKEAFNKTTLKVVYSIVIKDSKGRAAKKDVSVTFKKGAASTAASLKVDINKFVDFTTKDLSNSTLATSARIRIVSTRVRVRFRWRTTTDIITIDYKNLFLQISGYPKIDLPPDVAIQKVNIKTELNESTAQVVFTVTLVNDAGKTEEKDVTITFTKPGQVEVDKFKDFESSDTIDSKIATLNAGRDDIKEKFLDIKGFERPNLTNGYKIYKIIVDQALNRTTRQVVYQVMIMSPQDELFKKNVTVTYANALQDEANKFKDFRAWETSASKAANLEANPTKNIKDQFEKIRGYKQPTLVEGTKLEQVFVKIPLNKSTNQVIYTLVVQDSSGSTRKDIIVTYVSKALADWVKNLKPEDLKLDKTKPASFVTRRTIITKMKEMTSFKAFKESLRNQILKLEISVFNSDLERKSEITIKGQGDNKLLLVTGFSDKQPSLLNGKKEDSSGLSAGAIAGIAISSLIGIGIIWFSIYQLLKWKGRNK